MAERFELKTVLECSEDEAYQIADILSDGLSEHSAEVTIAKAD